MNRLPIAILFLFFMCFSYSHSALFLQLDTDDQGVAVDTTDFPNLSAKIKAYDNGKLLELDKDNFYIVENIYSARPFKVEKTENDYYKITWKTKRIEFGEIETADIFVKYQSQVKKVTAGYYPPGVGSFIFSRYNMGNGKAYGAIYGSINLGILEPVTRHNYYYCIDVRAPMDSTTNDLDPFMMDSITVDNDKFEVEWLGTRVDMRPLPKALTSERYIIKISVTPDSYDNIHTNLVFHYEPGIKKKFLIVANRFDLDVKPTLQLLEPNGGEVFAPCEDVLVKWKGHKKDVPVIISYSTDSGENWVQAGKVVDSTFMWKVPNKISETVKLKVHQEFKQSDPIQFGDSPYNNWTLGYDNASTKIAAVARAGKVNLYDLVKKEKIESRFLGDEDDFSYRFNSLGIAFSEDNNSYVIGYNDANNQEDGSFTFFRKFTVGKEQADYTIAVGRDFQATEMFKDNTSKYLVFHAKFSPMVLVFNLETGTFLNQIDLKHPILSMELSREESKAIVHNLDNKVDTYSIPDFNLISSLDKSDMPISYNLTVSPDGKYAFIAEEKGDRPSGPYFNNLMDLSSGEIVSFTGHNFSYVHELQFNAKSTSAAIASSGVPQISFFDLTQNKVLENSISAGGASLSDFQFAPDGHSIAHCMQQYAHFDISYFNYPEFDESDNIFAIREAEFDGTDTKTIPVHLIAEERDYSYSDFCNIGETRLFIADAFFQTGRHFTLVEDFTGDTVYPGECLNYSIIVNPKDVGLLRDTLIFTYCESEIKIPFEVESLNRNLGFDQEPVIISEEVCVGTEFTETIKLFTNMDPIPIKINKITFANYPSVYEVVAPDINDSILMPGESITADIKFTPTELGVNADSIKIIHSDAEPYYIPLGIQGTGIGAFVEYSHDRLPFVPESPERELQIINTGVTAFSLQEWDIEPEGAYEVLSELPINVAAGDTQTVIVKWNGEYTDPADLSWTAEPCLLKSTVELLQYHANYTMNIPDISCDPLEKVSIPLEYTYTQNSQYKGYIDFISEIKLYKRLFKPESVSSEFGEASILEERTDDYFRYIKIKVRGDFDTTSGVAASIIGYPGVADVIETDIYFTGDQPQWSVNTQGTLSPGSLTITGVGDRRLIATDNPVAINKITPNPGSENVEIEFETKERIQLQLQILDQLGEKLIIMPAQQYQKSESNTLQVNCSELPQGVYNAILKSEEHVASKQLIIIR